MLVVIERGGKLNANGVDIIKQLDCLFERIALEGPKSVRTEVSAFIPRSWRYVNFEGRRERRSVVFRAIHPKRLIIDEHSFALDEGLESCFARASGGDPAVLNGLK